MVRGMTERIKNIGAWFGSRDIFFLHVFRLRQGYGATGGTMRFTSEKKVSRALIATTLILFIFSPFAVGRAVEVAAADEVLVEEKVEFEGEATVEDNDQVKARKEAITKGLQALLENRLQEELTEEQLEKLKETIERQILKNPFKFIKKYRVLRSSVEEQLYKVVVSGKLRKNMFREAVALVKASVLEESKSRVLIMLAEKAVDNPVYMYWWGRGDNTVKDLFFWSSEKTKTKEEAGEEETEEVIEIKESKKLELTLSHQAFLNRFLRNGYEVLELTDTLKEQLPSNYHKLELSKSELTEIANLYEVQYVLHGKIWSQSRKGGKTRTYVKIHFYSLEHDKDLLFFSQSYKTPLSEKILKSISYVVFKKLAKNLLTKSYKSKDLEIVVHHPRGFQDFQRARVFLEGISHFVIEKMMKKGQTRFRIKTTKSRAEITELIAKEKGFEIAAISEGVLSIVVSKVDEEKNDDS